VFVRRRQAPAERYGKEFAGEAGWQATGQLGVQGPDHERMARLGLGQKGVSGMAKQSKDFFVIQVHRQTTHNHDGVWCDEENLQGVPKHEALEILEKRKNKDNNLRRLVIRDAPVEDLSKGMVIEIKKLMRLRIAQLARETQDYQNLIEDEKNKSFSSTRSAQSFCTSLPIHMNAVIERQHVISELQMLLTQIELMEEGRDAERGY
jgi:hypothetical protein